MCKFYIQRSRFLAVITSTIFLSALITSAAPAPSAPPKQIEITIDRRPAIDAAPKWIIPISFQRIAKSAIAPGEESRWLLSDKQINVPEQETFVHTAKQIFNRSGVQNSSRFTIDYDPSFQTLLIHWARVWRGNASLNRLQPEKIKVIQPERNWDEYLFTGQKSAVLIFDDIRADDILDIAYTVRGDVPGFNGAFSDSIRVQSSVPIEHVSARLLWPPQRKLFIKNHGTIPNPITRRTGALLDYRWEFNKIAGVPAEDQIPVWYDPHAWIQLSEFQTWGQVNELALRLFTVGTPLSRELLDRIAEWKRIPNTEARARAIVQFVQEDVRYQGIEESFAPIDPSTVFTRRFGDCKDKALLLVSIMRAIGFDAAPVLVNTQARFKLDEWQPTPFAFDHAIVQLNLNGATYWIDATRMYQRGPFAKRYHVNYGRGLVVRPKTAALTVIPESTVVSERTVTEQFQLGPINQPADLKVTTVVAGRDAEILRSQLATTPRDKLEKTFLNNYAARYGEISPTDPIAISDDEEQNRIELTESYSVPHIWQRTADNQPYHCEFVPTYISALLARPSVSIRTQPLAIPYPSHETCKIEATFPENWFIPTMDKKIEDPAFTFHRTVSATPRNLVLQYDYDALTESVAPQTVPQYLRDADESARLLPFWLIPQ